MDHVEINLFSNISLLQRRVVEYDTVNVTRTCIKLFSSPTYSYSYSIATSAHMTASAITFTVMCTPKTFPKLYRQKYVLKHRIVRYKIGT